MKERRSSLPQSARSSRTAAAFSRGETPPNWQGWHALARGHPAKPVHEQPPSICGSQHWSSFVLASWCLIQVRAAPHIERGKMLFTDYLELRAGAVDNATTGHRARVNMEAHGLARPSKRVRSRSINQIEQRW